MRLSAPSRLKRFWPRYLVWMKPSNASAALSRSRIRRCCVGVERGRRRLDVGLDPLLLLRLLDVHVLDADRARVRVAQDAEDVAQRHRLAAERCRSRGRRRGTRGRGPRSSGRSGACRARDACAAARRPSGSRFAIRWPRTRYMLMSWWTLTTFSNAVFGSSSGLTSRAPARRLVRHAEALEDLVVEAVLAEQELVHPAEELAALGAADDPVVVRARERERPCSRPRRAIVCGSAPSYSAGYPIVPTPMMNPWPGHEPRHRVDGADHPGVRDRAGRARRSRRARACWCAPCGSAPRTRRRTPAKSSSSACLMFGTSSDARAVGPLDVDREAEVEVLVVHDRSACRRRPRSRSSSPASAARPWRSRNAMRWVKLTLPRPTRFRWLFRIWRLTSSSFAGTVRTDVAVGTSRLASMFSTIRAAEPRERRRGLAVHDRRCRGAGGAASRRAPAAPRWARARRWACRRRSTGAVRSRGGAAGRVVGEEVPPRGRDRARVLEELAVHLFDEPGVRAQVFELVGQGHRWPCAGASSGRCSVAEELGGLEREIERLARVEPRVAHGLVPLLEVGTEDLLGPTQALGDVLAGQLDVHAAGPDPDAATRGEERCGARPSRRRSAGSCNRWRG